jgi:hypothetical protein
MDGLAIPEEKRGYPDSRWQKRLSASFAYASLACSLSLWLDFGLGYLYVHLKLRGLEWLVVFPVWKWVLVEAFALLLAMVAAALHLGSKLWRVALPLALLMFLLTYYVMVS